MLIVVALALGFVAGLRVFTPLAALLLLRGGTIAIVFAVLAVLEYAVDLWPQIPSRTSVPGLIARAVSGAFCGWLVCDPWGSAVAGVAAGIAGAMAGAYVGHAARLAAIARIGAIPAGLVEDVVAIGIAGFAVTR